MSVVAYVVHRVAPLPPGSEERGTAPLHAFARHVRWLRRLGVEFVPASALLAWLAGAAKLPRRAAVLTFDDAYDCVAEHAFPVLARECVPFTVFVVAGLMGRTSHLYADKGGQPHRHLDVAELRELARTGLVELGAHGVEHLDLTAASAQELEREVVESRRALEAALEAEVPYFAYPYGRRTPGVVEAVRKAGYKLAFTTEQARLVAGRADPLQLPRVRWSRRATLMKLFRPHLFG